MGEPIREFESHRFRQWAPLAPRIPHVKTYAIDVQGLASAKHDKGLIEFELDVSVQASAAQDEHAGGTCLRLPIEQARAMMLLLKQQLAELDILQPRSRRSGRC